MLHCQHKVWSGQGVLETDPKEQATIFAALSEMKVKSHCLCLVLLSSLKWLVMLTHKDEMAKSHPERQQLIFTSLSLHVTICVTRSPSGSVSLSSHLHGRLIPLSTDTAIINHRKEYSQSRLHTAVGRLPACLPASFAQRFKQRFHTDPRTPRSKEQARVAPTHFLLLSSPILSKLARTWWPGSKPTVISGW